MTKAVQRTVFNYCLAISSVALVMLFKAITDRLFGGGPPLILFLVSVMVTSRFCGFGPGIAATAFSSLVCMYSYFPPVGSFEIHSANDAFQLGMFVLESVTLSALMESLHAAARRIKQGAHDALLAEKALREGEERFHHLVQSVEDYAIIMLDPNGYVTSWNSGAERINGYRADEIIGQHFSRFYRPEDNKDGRLERVLHAVAHGEAFQEEGQRVRKDGSLFWAHVVIRAIKDETGKLLGFSKVTRDITERRRLDEELRRSHDLAQARDAAVNASRAKSEFLANMSHEIRTPMNGILGMSELLLDTELTREQRESMELVKSSTESLMEVINDILDYSKIEAGKLDFDPIEFQLRDLLHDALKTLALRAHHKGLELICDIGNDVPQRVIGDPGRLRQVVVNLVGNAVKFTERGEVVVRANLVRQSPEGYQVEIEVVDTGIGIPAEKQRMIFDPFSQADGSTTRRYGGTGLGLTISSRIVALMGGQIGVRSEVGAGSTFHFAVSFGKVPSIDQETPTRQTVSLRGRSVLVVDDNETNRRALLRMLRLWDMRPKAVDSGRAALAELRRAAAAGDPYPLMLVDRMMPEMDGFTLVEETRKEPAIAATTIMMLTSADRQTDAARCRTLRIAGYLVKPIKADELQIALIAAFNGAIQNGQTLSPPKQKTVDQAVGPTGPRSLRILLAEDNPVNQRVASYLLQKAGHSVKPVGNGREAIVALENENFDLVLMDVQMPEMDGFEATQAIRNSDAKTGRHVPIIAMTAHAMKGDRERCLQAGMDDYVSKPIQKAVLFRAIEAATALVESPPKLVAHENRAN